MCTSPRTPRVRSAQLFELAVSYQQQTGPVGVISLTERVVLTTMSSVNHLVPFVRPSDDSDDAMANIRSLSLEGAWRVPLSLVRMEAQEIIRLALTVSNPSAASQDYATTTAAVSPLRNDDRAQLPSDDQSAACVPLDQPPTASEARTLQEYRALMALGSVFALVKYWVFMRMLWRHEGESDRVVISVMAHSENMKQPAPLRNAKNRKRWTIVRHGLNLMEILLNNRSLLLEVMKNRHLSFTNLICLRSDYLTPSSLLRLVEKTQHLTHEAQPTRGNALSLATLSALCQQGDGESIQQTTPRLLSSSSPASASSATSRRHASRSNTDITTSDRDRSARRRSATIRVQSTKKRKRHSSPSRKRNDKSERRSISSSDSNGEDAVDDSDSKEDNTVDDTNRQQHGQQMDEAGSSQQRVDASSSLPLVHALSAPVDRLPAALWRMASVPLLDYFYELLETYPQQLSVAASLYFESAELHQRMMSHRLHEQCSTFTPLYDHGFLLRHSDRLRFLPALSTGDDGHLGLHGEARPSASTNVWVFLRGDSGGTARLYQQLLDDDHGSMQFRQQPLVPAELLLQHGMHLVLVFQREGETVAQPSGDELQLLHCVHDVCAGATLSAGGLFCSQKHLIEALQRRAAAPESLDAALHSSEMEHHTVALPAGVFKSSPLAQVVMLTKPSVQALQRAGQAMVLSGYNTDFASFNQMLYLLDQSLDDLDRRRVAPPLHLLPLLQQLCQLPGLSHASHQAVLLALLTKIIALHTATVDATPFTACSPGLGCGVAGLQEGSLPCMTTGQDMTPVVVFRRSEPSNHQRLLYIRAPYACRVQQQTFHDDFYDAVLKREEPCTYQLILPSPVVETTSARAPCCASGASADDIVDDSVPPPWKQRLQSCTRAASPAILSPHVIRASPVVSVDNLVLSSAAASSSLRSKLSTFLPGDLVNGGVLNWCQAGPCGPSYHLFVASELAMATRQVHSVIIPVSERAENMGWYSHMVNHRPRMESAARVSLASVRQAGKQSEIEELYGLCTELASLVQAADVVDEPSQCLLSPFVSTTYGELDQTSAQKVIECMVENGLRADSLFLDIGCCYCKVLVHVAYATGINVYGVEAVRSRSERGRRCVQRWKATHPELARQTGGIEILSGDIVHNVHLLFPASHVLLMDDGFMRSARNVLKHLWGHLADAKLQMVFTCTLLEDVNHTLEQVAQLSVNMGEHRSTLYAYKIRSARAPAAAEVFLSPLHGLGLRATRDFAGDETVMTLSGEMCSTYSNDDRWPWMVRHAEGGWLHVENLARFVNWHHEEARVNVTVSADADGTLRLQTTRPCEKGEEFLSRPSCWAFAAADDPCSEVPL